MRKHIQAPFSAQVAKSLQAGEQVYISGSILVARDAAHKRLSESLARGEALPIDLTNQVIYYMGPSPAKPGQVIGSAGPTTSGRMDPYTPALLEQGVKGMIGKGYRSVSVLEAMQKHGVPYLVAIGGAGALLAKCIKSYTVLAYEDLGAEAIASIEVENFPAIVAIDCQGNNYYEVGQKPYREI